MTALFSVEAVVIMIYDGIAVSPEAKSSLAQSLRHNKIGHVIEREGIFEPIVGELSSAE